jgi:NAD(P)-dependent dehydrogenase (short-subunit alcohol dehydrogenase family)
MDVTKEDEVKNAAVVVNKWINDNDTAKLTTSPRLLHALVNNAGIGSGGLIDWLNISVFRKDMEGEQVIDIIYGRREEIERT